MFETHEMGRMPLHPELFSSEEHAWNFVELDNNDPWLIVSMVVSNVVQTMFLQSRIERQIPELLSMGDRHIKLIQLVRRKPDTGWTIDDIQRIRVGFYTGSRDDRGPWRPVREYVLASGERFAHTESETVDGELREAKVIYSAFPRAA